MAVYAIGDIQGCADELDRLLDHIAFDPAADRLWFAGDLVNRGPGSLDALRRVHELDPVSTVVLGNHDLHLLAVAWGAGREKRGDTLRPILEAPDREVLLEWLRRRPLFHQDPELGYSLVHAGLPPIWDSGTANRLAREVEAVLGGPDPEPFFHVMYGDQPDRWDEALEGWPRLRYIVNALTRLRYVRDDGRPALAAKGAPGSQPSGCHPWFDHPDRASRGQRIVFGHWSTLGLQITRDTFGLDTGCLWGGRLTALQLDTEEPRVFQVDCPGAVTPGTV